MEKEKVSIVIGNASSLILLAKLNRFDLLKNIFGSVIVPFAVKKELLKREEKTSEILILEKELKEFMKVVEVKKVLDLPLGDGEKEAISLCLEKNVKIFLSDDKKARKFARTFNLETIGIMGIFLKNLQNKRITKKKFLDLLEKLMEEGYYISPELYNKIMRLLC